MPCSSCVSLQRLLVVSLALGACASACAADGLDRNRYKWRDAAGGLHYSDALPPDAAKLGYEVVSPQGITIKRVERAKTADELATAQRAQKQMQAERDQADALARRDAQLVSGYPTEADLKRSQQQKLELLEQQVTSAKISLRSQEQTLADLLDRAAEAERGDKVLPEAQAKQLASSRKQVDDQRVAVERREHERDQAKAQFESETTRYRELKARAAVSREQPAQ